MNCKPYCQELKYLPGRFLPRSFPPDRGWPSSDLQHELGDHKVPPRARTHHESIDAIHLPDIINTCAKDGAKLTISPLLSRVRRHMLLMALHRTCKLVT